MAKARIKYVCTSCGYESVRWVGKCPGCDNWNTFTEELEEDKGKHKGQTKSLTTSKYYNINQITVSEEDRIKTDISEFDRVLGGGFMPGSVVLLGGDPGIGKSTLAMQALANIKNKVLYVSGEESYKQIKLRAGRLGITSENFNVLVETNLNKILPVIDELEPQVVVIDSIQTMYVSELDNSAGSVTQIRECAQSLIRNSKEKHFCAVVIGHVTKEGYIAGPKILEHIVDAVVQFEGDTNNAYRILRAQKNRFGSINEIGVFEMVEDGLREVSNPSELFLSERGKDTSGSVVTASLEGTRPLLLEVQALVTPNPYGNPQRTSAGIDYRRLSILLAVIEKRANFKTSSLNIFLNLAGGVRIDEPAIDLAICASIISNILDKPVDPKKVIVGEVGLGGEIRSISQIEKRVQEAEKLGFDSILIPYSNAKALKGKYEIELLPVKSVLQAIHFLFN